MIRPTAMVPMPMETTMDSVDVIAARLHEIPDAVLTQHIVTLGKTRSGKSTAMRLLVERLLDNGKPVVIVDPKGDWWGLKSSADGKRAGYRVTIFGGEHADMPLNEHAGAEVAELLATGNRPAIIDLGGWMVAERTRFFIRFASTFFKFVCGPHWLVIDEVHNFAPQRPVQRDVDANKMLHWASRLASEGAGRGITLISASQRPQKVYKDYLTNHETLIAKRVIHPLDRGAIKDWIDGCGDPDKGREVLNSLANMNRADGWVWSPEAGFGPCLIHFPMFKTYDSFAAPTGLAAHKLTGWAAVDMDEVRVRLAALVEEAKRNDPALLQAEIAKLKRELAAMTPASASPEQIAAAEQRGEQRGYEQACRILLDAISEPTAQLQVVVPSIAGHVETIAAVVAKAKQTRPPPSRVPALPLAKPTARPNGNGGDTDAVLIKGEIAVLKAIAQYPEGVTQEQLTVLTGYKRTSRQTYVQRLCQRGYVEQRDGRMVATAVGIAALGSDFEPLPPSGKALRDHVMARLSGGAHRTLLHLINIYPAAASPAAVGEATNYRRTSTGTFIQRLVAMRLVVRQGRDVRASEVLF
jgi:hypothetical protein